MSLLSELEELQRCLEDTTDSESETVLQQKASGDTGNDLESLLQSEYISLAVMSEETSQTPSKQDADKMTVAAAGAVNEVLAAGTVDVDPNTKEDTPSIQNKIDTESSAQSSNLTDKEESISSTKPVEVSAPSDPKLTEENSTDVSSKSIKEIPVSEAALNVKSLEDVAKSDSSDINTESTELDSTLNNPTAVEDSVKSESAKDTVTSDVPKSDESKAEAETKKQEDPVIKVSGKEDCISKSEMPSPDPSADEKKDLKNGDNMNTSEKKSPPVTKSPGVKKRKLYTERPFESDLVEVPKGGTSPEVLLKLQNSNKQLKIRKPRSSPMRKRKLVQGTDSVPEAKKKKVSTGKVGKTVGSLLPVEVVVSPLRLKEPRMEEMAERLGKQLLEARVVVKRLNIPVPDDESSLKLQSTLEVVSKEIQDSLTSPPLDDVAPQTDRKPRAKPKVLQKQVSGLQKIKVPETLQKKAPPRGKPKPQKLIKTSIIARIGPKKKKVFTSKLQSRPVKSAALNKRNNTTFTNQKPKEKVKPKINKTSAPPEIKPKKVVRVQNTEKQAPKKGVNFSSQKKIIQVKNTSVPVEKKITIRRVSKKNCVVGRRVVSKSTGKTSTDEKNVAVTRKSVVPVDLKQTIRKPQLKIVKLDPKDLPFGHSKEKVTPARQSKPATARSAKDEDNTGEDEWLVEYLIDEDVDFSTVKDMSKVSSSDDRRPSLSETMPECDSSTDKKVKRSVLSVSKPDVSTECKITEMRKVIGDLERIADRSVLRLKAEERKVVYLSNKLRYYENDKHFRTLHRILKDAAPGPKQNSDAVFIVDLLLSYCPDDNDDSSDVGDKTSESCGK